MSTARCRAVVPLLGVVGSFGFSVLVLSVLLTLVLAVVRDVLLHFLSQRLSIPIAFLAPSAPVEHPKGLEIHPGFNRHNLPITQRLIFASSEVSLNSAKGLLKGNSPNSLGCTSENKEMELCFDAIWMAV